MWKVTWLFHLQILTKQSIINELETELIERHAALEDLYWNFFVKESFGR